MDNEPDPYLEIQCNKCGWIGIVNDLDLVSQEYYDAQCCPQCGSGEEYNFIDSDGVEVVGLSIKEK